LGLRIYKIDVLHWKKEKQAFFRISRIISARAVRR